jgi:hypothetical protein
VRRSVRRAVDAFRPLGEIAAEIVGDMARADGCALVALSIQKHVNSGIITRSNI